jgi:Glycosyltransferase Family 4
MRIAYVCYWFLLERDGVAYKIDGQVGRWRAAGHEVEVFCLTRSGNTREGWRLFPFDSTAGRFAATRELAGAVGAWRPDVVYLRYDLFLPPLQRVLRRFPTVVEVNADDREEVRLRLVRTRASGLYNEVNRRILLGRAKALVTVTRELSRSPSFTRFRKPTRVIGNGVDLDALRELPPPANERPQIVFLGSVDQVWHGVDKLGALARLMPDADFHVVGYARQDFRFTPPDNLYAHGALARHEFEPILARADLAIGTLALHRKHMNEACPLKVREYLGYGLPVVLGYRDTDWLDVSPWFLLELPNEEGNAVGHLAEIRAFLEQVRGRRVPRAEVADRIGAASKERARLELLAEVAGVS